MAVTFIDTVECARVRSGGSQGEVAEILNRDLCGARNVVGMLRWLNKGESLEARSAPDNHQLIYLMEGEELVIVRR